MRRSNENQHTAAAGESVAQLRLGLPMLRQGWQFQLKVKVLQGDAREPGLCRQAAGRASDVIPPLGAHGVAMAFLPHLGYRLS